MQSGYPEGIDKSTTIDPQIPKAVHGDQNAPQFQVADAGVWEPIVETAFIGTSIDRDDSRRKRLILDIGSLAKVARNLSTGFVRWWSQMFAPFKKRLNVRIANQVDV